MLVQELFTALLINSVANLDIEAKRSDMCDITVADILGPLKAVQGPGRDDNFSLLSYSYSLVSPPAATSNSAQLP